MTEPEVFDVVGDPDDFAAMPDAQLLTMLSTPGALLELVRRGEALPD